MPNEIPTCNNSALYNIVHSFLFILFLFSTTIFWRCVPDAVPGVAGDTAKTFFESSGNSLVLFIL